MAEQEHIVLCASNHYEQKYYFNPDFSILPQHIQEELKILCVLFTEEVGGVFSIEYDENGQLQLCTSPDPEDIMFDEIGAGLKIKQMQMEKTELFESLELFYRIFTQGETE